MGRCERVFHFMGHEVKERYNFRKQAVKWVVTMFDREIKLPLSEGQWTLAKLQGDNQHPNLPWNFIAHGFLHTREEHSMDQCRSRPKLSENFERRGSIPISWGIHMDQSLVHAFSWGNSYGPMVLKVLQKFPPTLVLVRGWSFPAPFRVS